MEYINQSCIKVTHLSTTGLLLSANLPTNLGVSGNFLLCSVSKLNLINTSIPQFLNIFA